MRTLKLSVGVMISAACLIPTPHLASTAQAQVQPRDAALEEITVTARKREESLLDVPLSITALTADDIETKNITQFKDIIDFTPGFFFAEHAVGRGDRSNRRLIVRNMSIATDNDHQQAATVFVDGVPMLGSAMEGLEDFERVEVVRGPQSAYFGRSTFAGAVNFVTKTPGDEFAGKITAEAGKFGTQNLGLQVEGPLVEDKLYYRVAGSQWQTDGHWPLANDPTITLGSRKTNSVVGTLYFAPTDRFSAKLRYHAWKDKDGPSAAVGYGLGNGESYFNCNPPGSSIQPINGANNYICGVAPFPQSSEIQGDFVLTPEKRRLLNGVPDEGFNLDSIFQPPFLAGFGLVRHAEQASLLLDYEFSNGMTLSSATAYHANDWMALDDVDRRHTAQLPGELNDTALLNSRQLEDYSQEVRLRSREDGRLRWLLGVSYFDFAGTRTSGFKLGGRISSGSLGNIFDIQTLGVFGSIEFDFNDQWTLSIEGRRQEDDVTEARTSGEESVSGVFSSFTPRVILDYKTAANTTVYVTYAEGTRPGAFNVELLGQPQSVLDQLAALGLTTSVPEEELAIAELGVKSSFLDGRARVQADIYWGDWDSTIRTGQLVSLPDGSPTFISANLVGGKIELYGFEIEGIWAATENLTLEGMFSLNKAEVKESDGCADCLLLLGSTNITGLGKKLDRSPETQGSLSATYQHQLNDDFDWYSRLDYFYLGTRYATQANLLETGDTNRVNLRVGIEKEDFRVEVYGENLFEDETFTNYQFLNDFANPGNRFVSAGLPDRRSYGVRAIYNF